jgi:transcriptional regulator with XRE-family HTH domain
LDPAAGVAVIGRGPEAAVRLADDRVSRSHVRLEPRRDGWELIDTSTNGMFVDGIRRSSAFVADPTTVHLGAADGIPVTLTPGKPADVTALGTQSLPEPDSDDDEPYGDAQDEADVHVARAGRAVAARRRELDITQRSLARDKIINAGTLIAFEKGRSWPRRGTLAKLEKVLQWSPGTIGRLRNGAPAIAHGGGAGARTDEETEVLTNAVQAPLMAEAVELAMHSISTAMSLLPKPSDPAFTPQATAILADLRKLEAVAANAARDAKGTPSVVLALSSVRRTYNELMLKAAQSPTATPGQRLYGARHGAELTDEEAANAVDVPVTVVHDVESERPVDRAAAAAVETLIAQLAVS